MQLTRAAAARAMREAEAASAALPPAASTRRANPDSTLAFARLSREVRQIIALEARLTFATAAAEARTSRRQPAPPEADEEPPYEIPEALAAWLAIEDNRRSIIRHVVAQITEQHPNGSGIRAEFEHRAKREILADPQYTIPARTILTNIADAIGLNIDGVEITQAVYDELLPHRFRTEKPEQSPTPQPAFIPPTQAQSTGPPRKVA